jgi:hypothetical protein
MGPLGDCNNERDKRIVAIAVFVLLVYYSLTRECGEVGWSLIRSSTPRSWCDCFNQSSKLDADENSTDLDRLDHHSIAHLHTHLLTTTTV